MQKKILVFDLDGVLFDTVEIMVQELLNVYPGVTPEMAHNFFLGNIHEEREKIAHLKKPETDEEKAERKRAYGIKKTEAEMFSGMKELLEDLYAKGYVLVTNTSAAERNCTPLFERWGLQSLFTFHATIEVSTSKVEKFKIICERFSCKPTDLLFITDTIGDVREADTAGISTIVVTWGAHTRNDFNKEPHTNVVAIVDSVEELHSALTT